jgi:hypothetical protein
VENKEIKIRDADKKNFKARKLGSGKKSVLTYDQELQIKKWILDIRSMGIPVCDELIMIRAKYINSKLKNPINCDFGRGWVFKFKQRHNIVRRKAGSKILRKNDCDKETIIKFVENVNKKIDKNDYFSVINIDETGLYYDPTINFTLDLKGTRRVEIKTNGREKERITMVIGIDLMDNIKIKPLIIFKGTPERCIKSVPLNDAYRLSYQANSWCDEDQFINFLSFLPKDKKILLIYDNFRSHKTAKVNEFLKEYPLVTIKLLPPNTTSILQPLDVGINRPLKIHIKKQYINWLLTRYTKDGNDMFFKKLDKKRRNILFIRWIHKSWMKINHKMIQNSFHSCGYNNPGAINEKIKQFYK